MNIPVREFAFLRNRPMSEAKRMGVTDPLSIYVDTDKTKGVQLSELLEPNFLCAGDTLHLVELTDLGTGRKCGAIKRQLEARGVTIKLHPLDNAPRRRGPKPKAVIPDMATWEKCAALWWGGGEPMSVFIGIQRMIGKPVDDGWCKYWISMSRYPTDAEKAKARQKARDRFDKKESKDA